MARAHRLYIVVLVVAGLIATPLSPVLLASQDSSQPGSRPSPLANDPAGPSFVFSEPALAAEATRTVSPQGWRAAPGAVAEARQWGRRRGHRRGHNDTGRTALFLGAIGAIAGTAVLVYANRPECGDNPAAGGCGYGTKVVGGAMLAAGAVGLAVGTASWR